MAQKKGVHPAAVLLGAAWVVALLAFIGQKSEDPLDIAEEVHALNVQLWGIPGGAADRPLSEVQADRARNERERRAGLFVFGGVAVALIVAFAVAKHFSNVTAMREAVEDIRRRLEEQGGRGPGQVPGDSDSQKRSEDTRLEH